MTKLLCLQPLERWDALTARERQDTLMAGEPGEDALFPPATSSPPLVVAEEFHPVMSDIDTIDLDGNTPLHLAVKGKNGVSTGTLWK